MSRNGAGVYSLPAGSTVANGDTSDATDINTPLADLESDANTVRPIVAGGTGSSTAAGALAALGADAKYTAGPASAVDNRIAVFDGTTGKLVKDGGATVAELATLASPTFTGTPLAPTAAEGTNTTQIASTAFVDAAVNAAVNAATIGTAQTWQSVVGSRSTGTSYQNTTGRPICVAIEASGGTSGSFEVSVDGTAWVRVGVVVSIGSDARNVIITIPPDGYYRIGTGPTILTWAELR